MHIVYTNKDTTWRNRFTSKWTGFSSSAHLWLHHMTSNYSTYQFKYDIYKKNREMGHTWTTPIHDHNWITDFSLRTGLIVLTWIWHKLFDRRGDAWTIGETQPVIFFVVSLSIIFCIHISAHVLCAENAFTITVIFHNVFLWLIEKY